MKYMLALLVLVLPLSSFAALKTPAETRFILNHGYGSSVQLGSQLIDKKLHVMKAQYDFASEGGTSGSHTLKDVDGKNAVLPDNAVIVDCLVDVVTAPTSSEFPKISLGSGESSTDLKAASILSAYSGLVACVPVGSAATSIKLTANRNPVMTVVTTSTTAPALTAGKINVFLQYLLSD